MGALGLALAAAAAVALRDPRILPPEPLAPPAADGGAAEAPADGGGEESRGEPGEEDLAAGLAAAVAAGRTVLESR